MPALVGTAYRVAPLVEAAWFQLSAARPLQADTLALGHVADLRQRRAGVRDALHRVAEAISRHGDQQLEVLPAGGRQLERGLIAARHLGDALGDRDSIEVDLETAVAGVRQVLCVGAE